MTQRHKHADVLIAIAEGKEVEYKRIPHDPWETADHDGDYNPIYHHVYDWRIKPEPEAEWKQKLRQAAREGKRIEYLDHKGEWVDCLINSVNPDVWDFFGSIEDDYRIVLKKVTRWLWAIRLTSGEWWQQSEYLTESETKGRFHDKVQRIRLDYTAQEFDE